MALTNCRECKKEVSTDAKTCPHCGTAAPAAKRKPISAGVGCLIILILLVVIAQWPDSKPASVTSGNEPSVNPEPPPKSIAENVTISKFSWSTTASGSIMEADFTIKNDNPFPVKDIEIRCQHSARSGTMIDSNTRTIFDVIPAKASKNFPDFNMGFIHSQAVTSSCGVTKVGR